MLDVGCGAKPYRDWVPGARRYVGIDVFDGPSVDGLIVPGRPWPVGDAEFDAVLCTQVLEHVPDLEHTVGELARVMRPGADAIISVPFIFGEHNAPHDYRRLSQHGLRRLLADHDLEVVSIEQQGAIGSTLGSIFLCWTFDALPRGRRGMLISAPLLPLWSLLCLTVNVLGAALDRVDRTGMYYGNLLVRARPSGIVRPAGGIGRARANRADVSGSPTSTELPVQQKARIIAFANQKGGVAKTTTTLNLAAAFAETGHRVLCVDMDPQGNLTMSQGIDPDTLDLSMYDVLVHHIPIKQVVRRREIDVACASIDLAGAEIAMSTQIGRERSLAKALAGVEDDYDFICIDTPPSLGLLTINALTAAHKVIVPVQCEYLSMRGLLQLQNTLQMIRENLNPDVQIEGILPTMMDMRTVHAKEAIEILEENFGDRLFASRIKKTVRFAEAPVQGMSVLKYDPDGTAAQSYRDLAKEVLAHGIR